MSRKSTRKRNVPDRLGDWMQASCHQSFKKQRTQKTYMPNNALLVKQNNLQAIQLFSSSHTKRSMESTALESDTEKIKIHPVTLKPYVERKTGTDLSQIDVSLSLSTFNHKRKKPTVSKKQCALCKTLVPKPHMLFGIEGSYNCPICFHTYSYDAMPGALLCGHMTCNKCFDSLLK